MIKEINLVYGAIEDALEEVECRNYESAKECLELAKEYWEAMMAIFEEMRVSERFTDYFYEKFGLNIPKKYTFLEALKAIEDLNYEEYYRRS